MIDLWRAFCFPLVRLDAVLQRHFDRLIYALMRRNGTSKRAIRRNGWCAGIAAIIAQHTCQTRYSPFWPLAIIVPIYLMILWGDDRSDERAEQSQFTTMPSVDSYGFGRKMNGYVFSVLDLALWSSSSQDQCAKLFGLGWSLAWLFQGFLCKTSPQAPKRQPKQAREAMLARIRGST